MMLSGTVCGQNYELSSPNRRLLVQIAVGDSICFSVLQDQHPLLGPSEIGIHIKGLEAPEWKTRRTQRKSVNNTVYPVVREKAAQFKEQYNELICHLQQDISLCFRAYDQGIAWRWISGKRDSLTIVNEMVKLAFQPSDSSWYPIEGGFYSHNERLYKKYAVRDIGPDSLASLPLLVCHSGTAMLITEADLYSYPGMWFRGDGQGRLTATFPPYPLKEVLSGDRNRRVTETGDFIAITGGRKSFPWRVITIASSDKELLDNNLTYLLSQAATGDFSWVKPGKVAWDWWNALNVYGVDFISGINTETYKYYVDFASRYGIEYIILDEGWSPTADITTCVKDIDMPALMQYARERNVGVILWVLWTSLDAQMDEALDLYESWGVSGIKVDFMQRDDQVAVEFYERTAREAARRKLLVDFHGSFKPTGMERLYPNVLTREGVYGLEQSKWDNSRSISPEHNVTLPFIRNAVGPMDYTPGAMLNAQRNSWAPIFSRPMSLGTRCHQLAMYVVYTSPLQMLADAPSNYYREPECMDFLSSVPSVWDASVPLLGKTGDYVAVARKAGNGDWYVGAMTDWDARNLEIGLSFLDEGNYTIETLQDGANADKVASDYLRKTGTAGKQSVISVHLAPGGGWVARLRKQ